MPTDSSDIHRRPSNKRWSTSESLRRGRGPPICRVPECNSTATPLSGPYDNQVLVSLYCSKHTCRWEYPPYDESCCPNPVLVKGQRLCDNHQKFLSCASTSLPCPQKRDYYEVGDSRDPTAPWFCSTHRCGHERCGKEGIGTENSTRRCDKHKLCGVPECKSPPDVQNDSLLCKQHTCRSTDCPNIAKKNNLCTEHQRCDYEGCNKPRYWPDTGLDDPEAPPLCERHFKEQSRCQRPDCRRPKENSKGRYCSEHECQVGGCSEDRGSSGSLYCHTHRCKKDGCPNPPVNSSGSGGSFCLKHTCKIPSCQRSTTSGTSSHCEIHSCSKAKCPNPAETIISPMTSAKPLPPLCRIHKCKVATCPEEATPISETTAGYCLSKHGCIETDCQKGRIYDDQGTPFERCADHERQRWKDAGRRDAEEAREAENVLQKKRQLKKEKDHKEEQEGWLQEKEKLTQEIDALQQENHELKGMMQQTIKDFKIERERLVRENEDLFAKNEELKDAHTAHQNRLRKGTRASMAAPSPGFHNGIPATALGPGGYPFPEPPGGHPFSGSGPMPIPGMNGSRVGRESPTSRSFRGGSTWDTSRDSLLSHQYDDHEYPYYSEEDRGGTPTDISFDHSSEHDPSQPQRGRIRDVPMDWKRREPRARDARELRDKSRGRVRGGTTDTIKDTAGAIARSPRDKSKPRRTKSKHRGATGGYGAYDALKRRSETGMGQWQGDVTAQTQAQPPLSSRRSKTFGSGKPRPVSMAGSVPDAYGGYGVPPPGHMGGYWGQRGHGEYYDSEE